MRLRRVAMRRPEPDHVPHPRRREPATVAGRAATGTPALARQPGRPTAAALQRLPTLALRQNLIRSVGQRYGNAAVQRMLASADGAAVQRQPSADQPTLRLGSALPAVQRLQQLLNAAGAGLVVDGKFGPATQRAVIAFQRAAGLTADGIVGPKTWAGLQAGGVTIPSAAGPAGAGAGSANQHQAAGAMALLGQVRAALRALAAGGGGGGGGPVRAATTLPPPVSHAGWLDDATAWAEEQVGAAAEWVGEQAAAAATWVEEQASSAGEWARERVNEAANSEGEQGGGMVSEWIAEAGKAVGQAADDVWKEVSALGDDLRERYAKELAMLEEIVKTLGQPFGVDLPAIGQQLGQLLNELQPGAVTAAAGGATPTSGTKINKSSSTYEVDAVTLTEAANRMGAEAGSVTRTVTALDLYSMDTDPNKIVKVAYVEIDLAKKMPKWKQFDQQCDAVKAEWNRFFAALDKHENNHIAKYEKPYTGIHSQLLGKSEDKANEHFDTVDKAANQANADYDTATDHGQTESPSTKINFVTCGLEKVP